MSFRLCFRLMMTKFCRNCVYAVLLFAVMAGPGCEKKPTPDADVLPEIEPGEADAPDRQAIEDFQATDLRAANQPEDWPQLFGPHRTSAVATPVRAIWGDKGPPLLWTLDVGTGYGSPAVVGDRVVFNHRLDDEEIVQCVDARSGDPIWDHRYATSFKCEMEYSDGPYCTPVIADGDVYTLGGQGQLMCLDLESGDVRWSRDLHTEYELKDDIFPTGSAPGVVGDRLIFNLGAVEKEAGIIALQRSTGETIWEATDHGLAYCSPMSATIHGQEFVFVVTSVGLVSLDPATGNVDWVIEHRCRAPMSYNSVSPLVRGNKVLVVTGPGPGAVCVEVQADRSYQPVWKNRRVIDSQFNTLMLAGDHVYGFTAAGQGGAELRCIDIDTGELKWKYHSLLRRGQGLIAGGAMIILGERGHLASLVVNDKEPKVLAFTKQPLMSEPCYCAPAISRGRLYLKDENRIACFQLD